MLQRSKNPYQKIDCVEAGHGAHADAWGVLEALDYAHVLQPLVLLRAQDIAHVVPLYVLQSWERAEENTPFP